MFNINMFGCGIRYWICKIPVEAFGQFEKLHQKYKEDYENLFFDLNVINKLGYSNCSDIYNIHSGRGFVVRERNRIEIKDKTKHLKRFDSSDLLYTPLMFDPYKLVKNNTHLTASKEFKLVALVQLETGSFFRFRLNEFEFDISKLTFHLNYDKLHDHFKEEFITHLTYNGVLLEEKKEDVVCTGNRVLFL